MRCPYATSFGKIPHQYISRDIMKDDILELLESDIIEEQAFKLTGIRGSGKTVMLSAIEKDIRTEKNWIVCDIRPGGDITHDLVSWLYGEVSFLKEFVDRKLKISIPGIGLDFEKKGPAVGNDIVLRKMLYEIKRKKKRVLVVIDEVRKTPELVDFIQEFQILIKEELPIFLIVAGLYEDIECIENTDGLTFFLRAEKYEMTPLNLTVIMEDYRKTLGLDTETAGELAKLTKGYAFAYQAFGKYMWQSGEKTVSDLVLAQVDEALSQKVYDKIWSELRPQDKWFMSFIVKKETMTADEILEITGKTHSEWSGPRARLIEKGILDGSVRGRISLKLPRFREYVESRE